MISIIEIASQAARNAGALIQDAAHDLSSLRVEQKSLHDYVSEVDRNSEKAIVGHILQHFPDHQIIGEEYGRQGIDGGEYQWVIDPLDGTTNFLRAIAHYAVSIGVMKNGIVEHAVVYDPSKDELFSASRGAGALLNGQTIKVGGLASIESGLLATGVPFSGQNLNKISSFTGAMVGLLEMQTSGIRRLGAAALDLAYVAAGRYDGFWEANLQLWDISAGVLLVEEAGGVVTDLLGGARHLESGDVLAANPAVHLDMLAITRDHYV